MQGNAALCCQLAPGAREIGTDIASGNVGLGLPGVAATVRPGGSGILSKIEQALQAATHGAGRTDTSGRSGGGGGYPGRGGVYSGAEVVDFPLVDPYRPIRRAGRPPVSGYTAFPAPQVNVQPARNMRVSPIVIRDDKPSGNKFGGGKLATFNSRGTEKIGKPATSESESGFTDLSEQIAPGIALPDDSSSGFGGLGSLGMAWEGIIGQITQTVPAIISATRRQPYYDPAANVNTQLQRQGVFTESGYPVTGAGSDIGASAGAAVGNVGDTIGGIVARHPYLVLGGGLALVLLFMNPPRRR